MNDSQLNDHQLGQNGSRVVSLAIIVMALVVLAGWHAHVRAAVQIFDGLIPMQYNTALCFLAWEPRASVSRPGGGGGWRAAAASRR